LAHRCPNSVGFPMGFTTLFHGMDVHGISAGYSMANPMGYLIGCPMALHIVSHGMYPVISHGFLQGFPWAPMGFLQIECGYCIGSPWIFRTRCCMILPMWHPMEYSMGYVMENAFWICSSIENFCDKAIHLSQLHLGM
jgi:hypothetical protein